MDGDVYYVEHVIRDRLVEARARAECAALRGEANQGSIRTSGFGYRLFELGRSLVRKRVQMAVRPRRPLGGALR